MFLFCIIVLLASCTSKKNDHISKSLYPITITIQDSSGRMDSAFVDMSTAVMMNYSLLDSGDWIKIHRTPIGYVHTEDLFNPPCYTEVKTLLGMESSRKEVEYPTSIVRFIGFKTNVPQYLLEAVRELE